MLMGGVGIIKIFFEKGGAAVLGCSDWWGAEGLEFTCTLHSCSQSGRLRAAGCTHLGLESFTGGVYQFLVLASWLRVCESSFSFPRCVAWAFLVPAWWWAGAEQLWPTGWGALSVLGCGCQGEGTWLLTRPSCHCLGASVPPSTLRQIGINSI